MAGKMFGRMPFPQEALARRSLTLHQAKNRDGGGFWVGGTQLDLQMFDNRLSHTAQGEAGNPA